MKSIYVYLPELGHRTQQHFTKLTCQALKEKGKPDRVTVKIDGSNTVKACVNSYLECAVPKEKRAQVCLIGKKPLEAYCHA